MDDPALGLLVERSRSNWVRLRTLVVLRWIAIVGQLSAILVGQVWFGLVLDIGLCLTAVGAAVIANLIPIFIYPENQRMSERSVLLMLLFDILQLSLLLSLTGGLNNPFALLILAPVTISASTLQLRSTLVVGALAVVLVSLVTRYHLPLRTADGAVMEMPQTFVFGIWVAIVIGIVFLAAYVHRVTHEVQSMSDALFATQMALSREQKLTDLGGVVAAAAHELGTPLATIKLASSELIDALDDRPDLAEDARLIRDQADRCRTILREMGRSGKSDEQLRSAPLSAVVREAAEPHADRGKTLIFEIGPVTEGNSRQPLVARRPEIIHGLRNLVQNAVDFARSSVWIDATWSERDIVIRIADDGPGYPAHILGRIGDPFVRSRPGGTRTDPARPEYEGMGLGLFIAKTLLERSGAEIVFANGTDPFSDTSDQVRRGAIVEVTWPRSAIAAEDGPGRPALGENRPITT